MTSPSRASVPLCAPVIVETKAVSEPGPSATVSSPPGPPSTTPVTTTLELSDVTATVCEPPFGVSTIQSAGGEGPLPGIDDASGPVVSALEGGEPVVSP